MAVCVYVSVRVCCGGWMEEGVTGEICTGV